MRRAPSTLDAPDPDRILVAQFRLRLHTHSPANATCHRQNFPRRVAAPRGAKIQAGAGPSRRFGLSGASLPGLPLVPAMTAFRKEIHHATARSIPRCHRAPASRRRQGDQPLLPQGKARPEAGHQDPVLCRDRSVLRDRLEPAPMRRSASASAGHSYVGKEGRGR